jgi:hypothetical protein
VERLEQAICDAVSEWSLAEVVTALQAMRGIDLIAAVAVTVAQATQGDVLPVGTLGLNRFGAEIGRGNVAEWSADCLRSGYRGWSQLRFLAESMPI